MDGKLVHWHEAVIHVDTAAAHYGASVFEGIRAYERADGAGSSLFRLNEHLDRLFSVSMRFLRLESPYPRSRIVDAIWELMDANGVGADGYVRICAYVKDGGLAHVPDPESVGVYVLAESRDPILASAGVKATLSPWRRLADMSMSPRIKASANYLSSRNATLDARIKGYDWPILLSPEGRVSEGPFQNVFIVRGGTIATPRPSDRILEGVTRDTVLRLAESLGLPVVERAIDPTELYVADEIFFSGTALEVLPVVEIDGHTVSGGEPGAMTEAIRSKFVDVVRGATSDFSEWLTPVPSSAPSI